VSGKVKRRIKQRRLSSVTGSPALYPPKLVGRRRAMPLTSEGKANAVAFAREHGVRLAARTYGVTRGALRRWLDEEHGRDQNRGG
jgi:hypothetical protein